MHRVVAALIAVAVWSATFAPVCAAVSPSDSSQIYTLERALDAAGATSPALAAAAAGLQATDAARVVEARTRSGELSEAKEAIERLAAIYRETREALERHIDAHS